MKLKCGLFFPLLLCISLSVMAAEYSAGSLKIILNENTGRFSLYAVNGDRADALFADEDPRSSFLSVMVNDRSYKMGDSSVFKTRIVDNSNNPAFIFESAFLTVTEEFSFLRTPNSAVPNAIKITITLENRGDRQIEAGARFLLDTSLGEKAPGFAFSTNRRTISSETLLTRSDGDQYWTDRNNSLSLTGSFIIGVPIDPDSIHIANWKKLSDVTWKAPFQAGRNFNFPPFSIGDSAVCYYFEPIVLGRGEKRSFGFFLARDYEGSFNFVTGTSSVTSLESIINLTGVDHINAENQDLAALRELIAAIDAKIVLGTATEEEIASIEFALNKLRVKYGNDNSVR